MNGHRQPLMRTLISVAAVALFLAACGDDSDDEAARQTEEPGEATTEAARPTTEGAPPTTRQLAGIWHNEEQPMLMRFSRDGTFAIDDGGNLDTKPAAIGSYDIEGDVIAFAAGPGEACEDGDRWEFQAGIPEDGRLRTTVTVDAKSCPTGVGTAWAWRQVSPRSPAGDEITAGEAGDRAAPESESLTGIWLLEGTGQLLRFSIDGTYALDDGGELGTRPDDQGTFESDGRGGVTFTSGARSRACDRGDRWDWSGTEVAVDEGKWTLRGRAREDPCSRSPAADLEWIRLSP